MNNVIFCEENYLPYSLLTYIFNKLRWVIHHRAMARETENVVVCQIHRMLEGK